MAIINGRRIDLNGVKGGVSGRDIIRSAGQTQQSGRRPIFEKGPIVQQIDPNKFYTPDELTDKYGRGAKISSMPDRSKGHSFLRSPVLRPPKISSIRVSSMPDRSKASFSGRRSAYSMQIITEQVTQIAERTFKRGVEFDEEHGMWMSVPNYILPAHWHNIARSTELLVVFPDEYPAQPPIGFYMKADIPASPNGHLYQSTYHNAYQDPINHGWKWYCVYIHEGAWRPAKDWRYGDNLFTYFHLISEALGSND